jgi:hypothetical protein
MPGNLLRGAKISAFLILAGALVKPASASIDYGNFFGTNFEYQQVTEGSVTSTPPLYGAPTLTDDSLVFNPTDFGASATNGGVQITDGTLTTTIVALGAATIDQIDVAESGDYTLLGAPPSTGTNVTVAAPVFLQIIQLNGVNVAPIDVHANLVFTPDAGSYNLLDNPGAGQIWSGSLSESVDAALAAAGVSGKATEIIYTMDNDLTAISQTGTVAFIEKKTADGVTITASVPEPMSIGWVSFAALALFKRRQRS